MDAQIYFWQATKYAGDSSHFIISEIIEKAWNYEMSRQPTQMPIKIGYLISERPVLARFTVKDTPKNVQIYARDVKIISDAIEETGGKFLHSQQLYMIKKQMIMPYILNLLKN